MLLFCATGTGASKMLILNKSINCVRTLAINQAQHIDYYLDKFLKCHYSLQKNALTATCANQSARTRPSVWVRIFMRLTRLAARNVSVTMIRRPAKRFVPSTIPS